MLASIKSDLRKLYTIRSTYILLIISFIVMLLFAFWAEGFKAGDSGGIAAADPHKLSKLLLEAIFALGIFGAIVSILFITHEYRYNTITYTLTLSRTRTQTLLSKVIVASIFALAFTLFVSLAAPALMYLGANIGGATIVHQSVSADVIWRVLFVSWGYVTAGLLIGFLIRQQVGAIAGFFIMWSVFDGLVGLILKDNRIYLPFTALQQVMNSEAAGPDPSLSPGKAAGVFMIYIVVGWLIAWILFLRRDAI